MSERWTDSKLIDDITIKYNKLAHVIVACSLVNLDGLELKTFNSLAHSIHMLQISYYIFVTPYMGYGHHLDI